MFRDRNILKDILWVFAILGVLAGIFRLFFGLGATTNLVDAAPWGLWKVFNMVAGVALSTSGFTIGLLVYVLGIKQFKPLVKPAVLIAFLGYGCSCAALLFDIGLPHRFWHPLVMWNHHSFLFEVFWCVLLYFSVTSMELLPTFLERMSAEMAKKVERWLHRITFGLVIVGISLSSLHHSSLGSLFLVTPQRLHALWYSSLLPIFFILSAMGGGLMVVLLLRIVYAWYYDREPVFGPEPEGAACPINEVTAMTPPPRTWGPKVPMLRNLALVGTSVLGVYLVLKIIDLWSSGTYSALLAGTWESWLFVIELALTAFLPILLLAIPRTRNSPIGLGVAALSATSGLVLNRLDVGIFGYFWSAESIYLPSWTEWALGIGVVAAAGLVFLAVVESFSIFDNTCEERRERRHSFRRSFDSFSGVWNVALRRGLQRVSVIAVFAVPIGWVSMYPPLHAKDPVRAVRPSQGVDAMRSLLRIDGDRQGLSTLFPHEAHRQRLGNEESCGLCHHLSFPQDRATPCSRCHRDMVDSTTIFEHSDHLQLVAQREELGGLYPSNHSCGACHLEGQPASSLGVKPCLECHQEDMWNTADPDKEVDLNRAIGFAEAMHGSCIPCHEREALARGQAELAECSNCHESLRSSVEELQTVADSPGSPEGRREASALADD